MPQSATANMALVQPSENGDADVWDTLLTTLFGLVDAHDHTTGKGVKVPSAGLKINADVSWSFGGTNYGITDIRALDFVTVTAASVSTMANAWFVSSADNELYWKNNSGTNIKITSGSTLNVAAFTGGIGGDYASISALLDYDDATDTYRFRQETSASVRQYAKISSADVIIREYDAAGDATVPAETITIKSPDALAASYALTFPAAVPGAAAFVQVSTAGVLTFNNTIATSITATSFLHTTAVNRINQGVGWIDPNVTHTRLLAASGAQIGWTLAASVNPLTMALPVKAGDVITGYSSYVNKLTNGAATIAVRLWRQRHSAIGTESAVSAGASTAVNAPGYFNLGESSLTITVESGYQYYVVFVPSGSVTGTADQLLGLELQYTRPV